MVAAADLVPAPPSDNVFIKALSHEWIYKPGFQITYVLKGNPGDTGVFGGALWAEKGAAQAFAGAAAAWAAVANISVTGVQVAFDGSQSRAGYTWVESLAELEEGALGQHHLPGVGDMEGEFGKTHSIFTAANNVRGGYSFLTFLHEIGHGLGLEHPHNEENHFPGVEDAFDTGDNRLNQSIYTVMSYNDNEADSLTTSFGYGYSATPMALDIAAIQHLYGANMSTATGDNVYVLPTVSGVGSYWACIWDAGGIDTIDGSAATIMLTIDLHAATLLNEEGGGGFLSQVRQIAGGFTIANGVTIENGTGGAGDDRIKGNAAANRLIGNDGGDTLQGYEGADYLEGGAGNDFLYGGVEGATEAQTAADGANQLFGGDGNDRIFGAGAGDLLMGGEGGDDIIGGAGDDRIYGEGDFDDLEGGAGDDWLFGGDSADFLQGGDGADLLFGDAGNDILHGNAGIDSFAGGGGDDLYEVDAAGEIIFEAAGEGTDTVTASAGYYLYANIENLTLAIGAGDIFGVGNALANNITGNHGANLLIAGDGNDVVHGGFGNDSLFGQQANDQLFGDVGIDYLVGGTGDDMLDGGIEPDALYGEDGNDTLWGGVDFQTDILVGGAGADVLHGDSGQSDYDRMDGGADNDAYYVDTGDDLTFEAVGGGTDTVYANVGGANNGVYLYANVENLVLLGTTAFGVGNELANVLTGSASGNWLLGGDGKDVLNGKAGNDVLFGEGGADKFVFEAGTGGDVIGDFQAGTDKIDLSAFGLSWQVVLNSMHENGGTTAIDLGNGDLIVLNGVASAALSQSDFILAAGAPAAASAPMNAIAPSAAFEEAGLPRDFVPHLSLRLDGGLSPDLF